MLIDDNEIDNLINQKMIEACNFAEKIYTFSGAGSALDFLKNIDKHQGFSDESAWARGQAWGLYGFTMMYRETGMEEFLVQAENIAGYILSQPGIQDGKIPYWDFNAPNIPDEPYDASAGAIITSALPLICY